jgi:hypothetical protein
MLPDLVSCYFCQGHNTEYCELKFCAIIVHGVVYSKVFFLKLSNLIVLEVQKSAPRRPSAKMMLSVHAVLQS